jgi:hypothetical protein
MQFVKIFKTSLFALSLTSSLFLVKAASALDYTFSIGGGVGSADGEILGIGDNTTYNSGNGNLNSFSLVLNNSSIGGTGVYSIAPSSNFTLTGGLFSGSLNANNTTFTLTLNFDAPASGILQNSVPFAIAAGNLSVTQNAPPGGVSSVPFEFSTTPGLIVLGGISGIAHFYRKKKRKNVTK